MSYEVTVGTDNSISVSLTSNEYGVTLSQVGQQGSKGADWQGSWVTSTVYKVNDVVKNNGTVYICILAHTADAASEPGVGGSTATYWEVFAEGGADGTDGDVTTANVTAAGALMDSEVTNLASVKAFNPADYATAAQGTKADNALPKAGGTATGTIQLDAGAREPALTMPANDIDMANGGVQTKTLTANTTFTESLADGDSVVLHLAAGATYTVTWPTMTWVGGSAPTLTADDVLVIWQKDATVYGQYVGSVA